MHVSGASNVDQFLFRAAEEVLGRDAARGMRVSGLRTWYYRVLAGTAVAPSGWQARFVDTLIQLLDAEIAEMEAAGNPRLQWDSRYGALCRQRAALMRFCVLYSLREAFRND